MTGCLDPGNFEIRIDSITYIETPDDLHVRTNSIKNVNTIFTFCDTDTASTCMSINTKQNKKVKLHDKSQCMIYYKFPGRTLELEPGMKVTNILQYIILTFRGRRWSGTVGQVD